MGVNIKKYNDTNYITGLRAFAALGVVLIHSGGAGLREFGNIGNFIVDLGRTGVFVFFVVTLLLLTIISSLTYRFIEIPFQRLRFFK